MRVFIDININKRAVLLFKIGYRFLRMRAIVFSEYHVMAHKTPILSCLMLQTKNNYRSNDLVSFLHSGSHSSWITSRVTLQWEYSLSLCSHISLPVIKLNF